MAHFTTAQLLEVADLPHPAFKAWVRRGHLHLSSGDNPGTGNRRLHDATDVLQAAVLVQLGLVGVGPERAALVWRMLVIPNLHRPECRLLFGPRPDGSDLDFRVVLDGQDDGLDQDDAPAAFAGLNIGPLKRRVAAKLAALS